MFFLMGASVFVSDSPLIEKFGIEINQRNSRNVVAVQHTVDRIQKRFIQFCRRVLVYLKKNNNRFRHTSKLPKGEKTHQP